MQNMTSHVVQKKATGPFLFLEKHFTPSFKRLHQFWLGQVLQAYVVIMITLTDCHGHMSQWPPLPKSYHILFSFFKYSCVTAAVHVSRKNASMNESQCAFMQIFCKRGPKNLLIRLKLGLSHPFCNSVSLLIICGIIISEQSSVWCMYVCVYVCVNKQNKG